jgi:hypothetical protein
VWNVNEKKASGLYTIVWLSTKGKDTLVYGVNTKDFQNQWFGTAKRVT